MAIESHSHRDIRALADPARMLVSVVLETGLLKSFELEPSDLGASVAEQAATISRLLPEVAREGLSIEVEAPAWKLADWGLHDSHLARLPGHVRMRSAARGGWLSLHFSCIERPADAIGNDDPAAKSFRVGARETRALAELTQSERKKAKLLEVARQLELLADIATRSRQCNCS